MEDAPPDRRHALIAKEAKELELAAAVAAEGRLGQDALRLHKVQRRPAGAGTRRAGISHLIVSRPRNSSRSASQRIHMSGCFIRRVGLDWDISTFKRKK